jgi:hypothetical protein
MKRKPSRIMIHRETLQQLDVERLRHPAGGLTVRIICPHTLRVLSNCIAC